MTHNIHTRLPVTIVFQFSFLWRMVLIFPVKEEEPEALKKTRRFARWLRVKFELLLNELFRIILLDHGAIPFMIKMATNQGAEAIISWALEITKIDTLLFVMYGSATMPGRMQSGGLTSLEKGHSVTN
jgi:hypothetical protein